MARGTAVVAALLLAALLATAPFDVLGTPHKGRGKSLTGSSVSRGTPECGGIPGCETCSGTAAPAARYGGGVRAANSGGGGAATCSACYSSYTQSFVLNGTTCGEGGARGAGAWVRRARRGSA